MRFPFKIIDLTHTLSADSPGWELECGFNIKSTINYDDCDTDVKFKVQHLSLPAGMGTHIDAPAHCHPNGATIDVLGIHDHHLIAQGVVIDVSTKSHEHYRISTEDILSFENQHGKIPQNSAVLFFTGWEKYWNHPKQYHNDLQFPSISADAAALLLKRNIAALGIDTLSPDTANSGFPVHHLFLSKGKYLIENVANANMLPPTGSWILSLPIKISQATEAPARVIGMIPI